MVGKVAVRTVVIAKKVEALTIDELINLYALSNEANGKSPKTIAWYRDMLTQFSAYLITKEYHSYLSAFGTDKVKGYILYLQHKPRFKGHPYTPAQSKPLSPKTVQGHVRALRAFSSWLHSDGHTVENRLKNLKLPKAPVTVMEPLTPEEIKNIIASINKGSPTGVRNHTLFVTLLDTGMRASGAIQEIA